MHLPITNRALVSRPSAQHNEHDVAFSRHFAEAHRLVVEFFESEVGRFVADLERCGVGLCLRQRSAEQEDGEEGG